MSDSGGAPPRLVTGLLSVGFFLVSVLFLITQLVGYLGPGAAETVASAAEAVWDVLKYPLFLHFFLYYGYRNDYADLWLARCVPAVRGRVWALRHPRLSRRYRELGAEDPYLTSLVLSLPEIERLNWKPEDLARLITCEVERQREEAERTGVLWQPGPPAWTVSGLADWTDRRPQDARYLAEHDEDYLKIATSERAQEYLRSVDDELSGQLVLWLIVERVDLGFFAEARRAFAAYLEDFPDERGEFPNVWDGIPSRGIGRTLTSPKIRDLTRWEVRGWLQDAETLSRHSLFRNNPPHVWDQASTWALWSRVAALVGEKGPHPALWKAAGFSPTEVPEALASDIPVPRTTLEAMAALRRPEPTGL